MTIVIEPKRSPIYGIFYDGNKLQTHTHVSKHIFFTRTRKKRMAHVFVLSPVSAVLFQAAVTAASNIHIQRNHI